MHENSFASFLFPSGSHQENASHGRSFKERELTQGIDFTGDGRTEKANGEEVI